MKKMMMVVAALVAAVVTNASAINLGWGVDMLNAAQDDYVDGLVQLYLGDGTLINSDSAAAGDARQLTATATFYQTGPIGSGDYLWNAGQTFYFMVFNATTEGAATMSFQTASFVMPSFPTANDNGASAQLDANISTALTNGNGYIDPTDSRWEPIPEPATMALVGIGAAVVALRRRFAKKA